MRKIGETRLGPSIVEGRVLAVDTERRSCRVQIARSDAVAEEVPLLPAYAASVGGGWSGAIPEEGDTVLMLRPSEADALFIFAYRALPEAEAEDPTRPRKDPTRDSVSPGDVGTWGSAGNRVTVRRSGLIEAYASGLAQTRWSRSDRSVRTFAFQHAVEGPFGSQVSYTQRDPALEEQRRTPVGLSTWLKATSEGGEIANLEIGGVPDEAGMNLPGRLRHTGTPQNSVAFRFLLFDPVVAARYAAAQRRPNPANAITAFRGDLSGNMTAALAGTLTENLGARNTVATGNVHLSALGQIKQRAEGSFGLVSNQRLTLSGRAGLDLVTNGDLNIRCRRLRIREENGDRDVKGDYLIRAGGRFKHLSGGDMSLSSAQTLSLTSRARRETVANTFQLDVGGGGVANLGRDIPAYSVRAKNGAVSLAATMGSVHLTIGPKEAPIASIHLRGDLRDPASKGRIEIGFPLQRTGLTLSPDGSWQITGPTGSGIKADVAGRIQLGTGSPVVGNVITTLSQPTCYVTGLPFMGHADLVVGSGLTAPLIGVPSVGVVPPAVSLPPENPVE